MFMFSFVIYAGKTEETGGVRHLETIPMKLKRILLRADGLGGAKKERPASLTSGKQFQ